MASVVSGYHGTSLAGAAGIRAAGWLRPAGHEDWLGTGVYFFQDAPLLAQAWARRRFGDAAVVLVAEVDLAGCMDLVDLGWRYRLRRAAGQLMGVPDSVRLDGHELDAAVINFTCAELAAAGRPVASVRAVFATGDSLYSGSALAEFGHIQVAVLDTRRIGAVARWRG